MGSGKTERNSSIELLKIVAIVMIVISHAVLTLGQVDRDIPFQPYYIMDLNIASRNIQQILLSCMQYFGALGNDIFFICSAWFLIDSREVKWKKVLCMVMDIWVISVIFLICFQAAGVNVSAINILKSLLPTTFANNWYITCYLIVYLLHPVLNRTIESLTQRQLLMMDLIASIMYFGICFLKSYLFFSSPLIALIVIYFLTAYAKRYMTSVTGKKTWNQRNLLIGAVGSIGVVLLTNFLGLRIHGLRDLVLRWDSIYNPFLLLTAYSMFHLFRGKSYVNRNINYLSSLSLFVYLIHENMMVRLYLRPLYYMHLYHAAGYSMILLWVLLLAAIMLASSLLLSMAYEKTGHRLNQRICEKIGPAIAAEYHKIMQSLLNIN